MKRGAYYFVIVIALVFSHASCSKRQIVPGIVAGTGGALVVGGVVYRASLPEEDSEGLLGSEANQKAVTATLLLTGIALATVGIIWSATTPVCEKDHDCFGGDACEESTGTCVPKPSEKLSAATIEGSFGLRLVDPIKPIDKFQLNITVPVSR